MGAGLLANVTAYTLQVACIAALGGLLARLFPIDAAAVRYAYWRALLGLCLVLPWLQGRPDPGTAAGTADGGTVISVVVSALAATDGTARGAGPSWPWVIGLAFAGGVLLRLLWIGISLRHLRRLRTAGRAATSSGEAEELQRLVGARADIRYVANLCQPVTFGARRPVILLPEALAAEEPGIRRAVLCHELLHVRRRDWSWMLVEELVRAALWFHPVIWWLVSRVQRTREEAVDEQAVLITGARRTYMKALLAFADGTPLAPAAAFGRRRHLFRRMVLISREAGMSSRRIVLSCALMAAAIVAGGWLAVGTFPMVSAAGEQEAQPGPLEQRAKPITPENPVPRRLHSVAAPYPPEALSSGVRATLRVRITIDDSGRVAEARSLGVFFAATLEDQASRRALEQAFARSALEAVRQWQYAPPAAAPISFTLTLGFQPDADARLLAQDTGPPTGAAGLAGSLPHSSSAPPWHEGTLRVGSHIRPPVKITHVNPAYPPEAKAAGIQGVVILEARIEADGRVSDTRVLRSVPGLDEAAVEAVRQWEFVPTTVNGEAVAIIMTVTIAFTLQE